MPEVVVLDYGIGNVFSVCNALEHVGCSVSLTRDKAKIRAADRLILPGVGAFSRAMENLASFGLDEEIMRFAETGRPFLGICIGMQALMEYSTEFGHHAGLGLIEGHVDRIADRTTDGAPLRVPHVAWSEVTSTSSTPQSGWLSSAFLRPSHYYFVHSFMAKPTDPKRVAAVASYGGNGITAAISRENIVGVQFHPERSGPAGLQFLQHFSEAS